MNKIESILEFSNEVLITFFEYLRPSDRRIASLCCKRFLQIWLHDTFSSDRRFVKYTVDSDLYSILMNTQREYKNLSLRIDDYIEASNEKNLWSKFGSCVTSITLHKSFWPSKTFWEKLTNLENLVLSSFCRTARYDFLPKTLKLISLPYFTMEQLQALDDQYLKFNPEVKLECKQNLDAKFFNFVRKHNERIKQLAVVLPNDAVKSDFQMINAPNLTQLYLSMNIFDENLFNNLEKQFPSVEHLQLFLSKGVPTKNLSCLKTFIGREVKTSDLSSLKLLENLEDLQLENLIGSQCFGNHKSTYKHKQLKRLQIDGFIENGKICLSCFKSLLESYPEVSHLICSFVLTDERLKMIQTALPKLKKFWGIHVGNIVKLSLEPLKNLSELQLFGDIDLILETWPVMEHLHELTFRCQKFTSNHVQIFERMPALETLTIRCRTVEGDKEIFKRKISQQLKGLKILSFV